MNKIDFSKAFYKMYYFNTLKKLFSDILKIENFDSKDEHLQIIEYYPTPDSSKIYALGVNIKTQKLYKLQIPYKSSLFIWSANEQFKNILINLKYIDTKRNIKSCNKRNCSNDFTFFDEILMNDKYKNELELFEIPTKSFYDSKELHTLISENISLSYFIITSGIWTIETFLMIHFYIEDKNYNDIYNIIVDCNFKLYELNTIKDFNLLSFDIETISHDPNRIPFGEHKSDIILSIAISKYLPSQNKYEHETIINLPLDDKQDLLKAKTLIHQEEKYDYELKRNITIFNTEEELLKKVFEIFNDISLNTYILLGYNSKNYDMPFLLKRCVYLNLKEQENFYFRNGILSYGLNMIHIDMYLVISKYYENELPSFTLKNVVLSLLNDSEKIDLDARLLRFVYEYILNNGLCNGTYKDWNTTLSKIAFYNDIDTILVLKLWLKLRYEEFLYVVSKTHKISLLRIPQTKIGEYLNNKIFYDGLKNNVVCTKHKNFKFSYNSNIIFYFDVNKLASSKENAASFGGGFNYRHSKNNFTNITCMDMLAYYPQLIEGFNLSHETVTLCTVAILKLILKCYKLDFDEKFTVFRFCTHKNIDDENIENIDEELLESINIKNYVYGYYDNGSIINIKIDLAKLKDSEKVVILQKQKIGILSKIIKQCNTIRNISKDSKKIIQKEISLCEELLMNLKFKGKIDDDDILNFDFDNFDINDIDLDILEKKSKKIFNKEELTLTRETYNCDDEIFIIKPHIKILTEKELLNFESVEQSIEEYKILLGHEFSRVNAQYRNMKIINSSIYGLLGSDYGILKGKNVAAAATMLGRKYIVESAKIGMDINCTLIYSDTDSVFFSTEKSTHQNPTSYIEKNVNNINSCLILNSKIYANMFIMARKKYIASSTNIISKGINKHGPLLWNKILFQMYNDYIIKKGLVFSKDVYSILKNLYLYTFKELSHDKKIILCTMNIKNYESYKTNVPVKKLIERILNSNPTYVFGKKITFFYKFHDNCNKVYFALDHELENTPISEINLYKFYSKIIKTIYLILSQAINRSNKGRNVYYTYPMNQFNSTNLNAYIDAYSSIKGTT